MTEQMYQYGIVGVVALLVVERTFSLLSKMFGRNESGGSVIVTAEIFKSIAKATQSVAESTLKTTEMIGNQQFMIELLQERQKNHEENAKVRHNDVITLIKDHGKECRDQAKALMGVKS